MRLGARFHIKIFFHAIVLTDILLQVKHWWWVTAGLLLLSLAAVSADGEMFEESEHEVLVRNERGAKNRGEYFRTLESS